MWILLILRGPDIGHNKKNFEIQGFPVFGPIYWYKFKNGKKNKYIFESFDVITY